MPPHICDKEETIDAIDRKVDQILFALKGDELGNDGIIPKLKSHEKRIISLELSRLRSKTIERFIIFAVSFSGTILGILSFFLFN